MASEVTCRTPYDQGYIDGLAAYAWWRDGKQQVGTSGKSLREAIRDRKDNWNYDTKATERHNKIREG